MKGEEVRRGEGRGGGTEGRRERRRYGGVKGEEVRRGEGRGGGTEG